VDIIVPPLRKRRDDVPALVAHFLTRYGHGETMAVAPAAMDALVSYDWPGNVRQLGRVLERAIALTSSSLITLRDLPAEIGRWPLLEETGAAACNLTLRAWSSRYARLVLDRYRGNKRRACDVLDISYHTLQALLDFERPAAEDGTCATEPAIQPAGVDRGRDSLPGMTLARLDPSAGE
jgi:transcriptional regulator with PAS, ATPase and Fis domain